MLYEFVPSTVARQLKHDDLGVLKVCLLPVAGYWIAIADQLGMTSQVHNIKTSSDNKEPADYLRDLLNHWLCREDPSPTLDSLCNGLREDTSIIGGNGVAKCLEEKFQTQRGVWTHILCNISVNYILVSRTLTND